MNFARMDAIALRAVARRGGKVRAKAFTREYQQMARSRVSSESCSRNGKLGAAVTRHRYGDEFLFGKWHAWKQTHPSPGEREVMSVLDQLSVGYDFNARFDSTLRTVDFMLHEPYRGNVIEVFGEPHECFAEAQSRDYQKLLALQTLGFDVLVIPCCDFHQTPQLVRDFLSRAKRVT